MWFIGRAQPIKDDKGNILKWFGTFTEIDELKRLQEDLKLNQKRRDDFIKMASHELKTPITTIKGLKQNPATSHLTILMMSAHPTAKEACLQSGADDFISKPFDMEQMIAKVEYILTRKQKVKVGK